MHAMGTQVEHRELLLLPGITGCTRFMLGHSANSRAAEARLRIRFGKTTMHLVIKRIAVTSSHLDFLPLRIAFSCWPNC